MKEFPAYSLLGQVFPGCVPVQCVETTLDRYIYIGCRDEIHQKESQLSIPPVDAISWGDLWSIAVRKPFRGVGLHTSGSS